MRLIYWRQRLIYWRQKLNFFERLKFLFSNKLYFVIEINDEETQIGISNKFINSIKDSETVRTINNENT
jgi:hypothetical protein